MMTYRGSVSLNMPMHLYCELCGTGERRPLPDLDRAGWDWFKGRLPSRVAICPACMRGRRAERADLMARAGVS